MVNIFGSIISRKKKQREKKGCSLFSFFVILERVNSGLRTRVSETKTKSNE
jgi:hypothetical protein